MKQINIALLGMGRIGKIHFKNIEQQVPGARISAVADIGIDLLSCTSQYPPIFFSRDSDEVISRPEVDAVLICTPTSSHAELIEKAITHRKHIFCEKPMDLSLDRTEELVQMAADASVKLMLGFNRRFDPDFRSARDSVGEGRIGEVQVVKITSRDPGLPPLAYIKNSGGLFMDMAIHDFDMARYIMGKEVTEVFSRGFAINKEVGEAGDIDTALTSLIFEDGTYGVIDNSREAVYGYDQRIEIFGTGGMIQVDNNLYNRNIIYDERGIHHTLPLNFFMDRYATSYLKEIVYFIDALANDRQLDSGGDDSFKATLIAMAAQKSLEEMRPVKISEILLRQRA